MLCHNVCAAGETLRVWETGYPRNHHAQILAVQCQSDLWRTNLKSSWVQNILLNGSPQTLLQYHVLHL